MKRRTKKINLGLSKQAKMRMMVGIALCQAFALPNVSYAQWEGLETQHGQATYQYNGNHLDVNVTTNALIANARSLDIAVNESVNVHQLTANNAALFRSIGPSASKIFGSLTSNGHLFLINQNGVLFGQGAQVDVGGLVASSMNISNADFLSGNYQFNAVGVNGDVNNQGVIKVSDGGYLVLLGKEVSNSGVLQADKGSIVMASADSAILDFYGNGLVKASLSGDALNAVVEQSGVIQADGGAVQLATNSRSSAVNVSGLVQANSLVERNGVIRLEGGENAQVAVSGTLNATGVKSGLAGGNIEVTGEQVAILGNAKLNASGNAGGGQVLVGGDYQGGNAKVQNARTTYVDKNAKVIVDAIETGDGGNAIVWADQITRYYGNISAKGGGQSGNGGFVEVSGKQLLDFIGGVDVGAVNGLGGYVLLDPENIVLNNSTQTAPANNVGPDIAFADGPAVGTTTIQISDVTGYAELFLQATNDITVANNITMATNNSIKLEANNNLTLNGEVRTQGTGNITLTADADNNGLGDLAINKRVFSRQGNIALSGANITSTAAGSILTQGDIGQNSGDVTIKAMNAINLDGSVTTNGRNGSAGVDGSNAGSVDIRTNGAITTAAVSANGGTGGAGDTAGGNAGSIDIYTSGAFAGDITINGTLSSRTGVPKGMGAGGSAAYVNVENVTGNVTTNSISTYGQNQGDGGNVYLEASAADVIVNGSINTRGGSVASGITGAGAKGGNVSIVGVNRTITGNISVYGGNANGLNQAGGDAGQVSITGSGALNTSAIDARTGNATDAGASGSSTYIDLQGSSVTTAAINASGGRNGRGGLVNIVSSIGDTTTGTINTNGGSANVDTVGSNAGSITINAAGSVVSDNLYANGSAGNGINQNGGNAGAVTLTAVGAITTATVSASGGNGGTGAGSNAAAGDAGSINIQSTGAGDITTTNLTVRNGNARGEGAGGSAGVINITNADGSITTNNIRAEGLDNGTGGNVTLNAENAGDVTVNGVIYTLGDINSAATTLTGRDAGNITVKGINTQVTGTIYADGGRGSGFNQAGGNAGQVTLTSSGALSTQTIYARTGNATDIATGGASSTVNLQGASVTTTSISVDGGRNGNGGAVNILSLSGDTKTGTISANGGSANVDTAGSDAGSITINSAGAVETGNVSANGSAGNGINQNGGKAGSVDITASSAITTAALSASGGYGSNGAGSNAAAGDAGSVKLKSTAAGDITTANITVRNGYARGEGAGGSAGVIEITNANGNITTNNIRAEGLNHGDGGNVILNAENAGDVTVNGVIYTYGDATPTAASRSGANAGNITIKGINTQITNTINLNGGRGLGVNQSGGNAGTLAIDATGVIATQVIAASGGNGASGVGSNAAGGDAGRVQLKSTGVGDITTSNITARTGYAQGTGAGGNPGVIEINNGNGSVITGNISTRGQRNGAGGDVTAIATDGNLTVGTVDARASNIPAINGGDVTLVTNQNATVSNILTGGRWLVYSTNPLADVMGAFKATADFKQYNTAYGGTLADSGNGFVYTVAPTISTSLSGTADKVYDGTMVAPIAGLSLTQTGAIDGDTINLSALISASYDDKHVGVGKSVTSNVLSITGATNGATQVYGYQLTAPTAAGNVGTISQRAITVTAVTDAKTYDGTLNSAGVPTITTGTLAGGDGASFVQTFDNKNVGTGKVISSAGSVNDGNSGGNYAVTFVTDNTGVINQRPITVTVNGGQTKVVGSVDPLPFGYSLGGLGLVGGDAITGSLERALGESIGSYAINQGTLTAGGNYVINYIGSQFAILSAASNATNVNVNPRNAAGLGDFLSINEQPQQFLAVFNVGATAAGGDIDPDAEICVSDQNKKGQNPNTSLMLNFGIKLPDGVKQTCI